MKKTETSLVVMSGGALKSIPLSAMTGDMWRDLLGGMEAGDTSASFYARVPWLYAGTNLIASACGSLPLRWQDEQGEAIEDTSGIGWAQSFGDLLNAVAGDLTLYGAAYVFRGNNRLGRPTELRRLLPSTVKPEVDAKQGLTHFTRTVNGQQQRLELADLVYIWEPNRTGEVGPGASRAQAALAAAGALAGMDASSVMLFANGAIRPTIISLKEMMPEAEVAKVESALSRRLRGIKNAFGFAAVSGEVSFSTIGDPPRDLAMPELTDVKRQDVATALGVPHSLLFSSAANYAVAQQDALNFYDLTVIPLTMRILSAFNSQCFEALGLSVVTAEGELELYQQTKADQVQSLSTMFGQRVITVNEFRERVGFAPLEDPAIEDEPEPESPADTQADALPEPEDNPADNQQREEMRAWQRFVVKRLKEGKQLRPFHAEHIPPTLAAAIEGGLAGAESASDVKAVFQDALTWESYP